MTQDDGTKENAVNTEYEARVLDIDPAAVGDLIIAKGGRKTRDTATMRRYVYDVSPGDDSRWLRLRDTGTQTTLTVKEITSDAIDGTTEVEVTVGDLQTTHQILGRLGFYAKSYQENRRTSYELDGARLEVDEWPMIPPYLEIEADSEQEVRRVAALLGYADEHLTGENTIKIYRRYGHDLNQIPELRFG